MRWIVAVFVLTGPLLAQDRTLAKPAARVDHQFSSILGARELSDGRLLVSDGIDNTLLRVNLATGKIDTIGRTGQGPGEYKAPDALFPMPNDSTLLLDLGNGRMSVFDGTQKYRESIPMAQGTPGGPGGFSLIIPRGVDGKGRLYYQPTGAGGPSDSAPVVRWDRAVAKFDTVARVKLPNLITKSSGGPNERRVSQRPPPYPIQETWAVGADGRIALVRAPGYRVDWVSAAGAPVVGAAIPSTPVPIKDAEKREYLAESAANGLSISVSNNNGAVSMSFTRGRGRNAPTEEPDLTSQEWPPSKPAVTGTVTIDPAGRLWVEQSVAAGAPRRFDLVGANGSVVGRVTLPKDRRLVTVGAKGVYLRHVDPDGLNYLERYDLP